MAWPVVGRSFSPAEFDEYVSGLRWDGPFKPTFIALHNTAAPSLAQRPDGLTRQHIANLENYYKRQGWNGGPHLFIDDRQIWVFNDLTKRGTHSPSWNATAIGIEMLGDYERESFCEGRGRKVRDNTIAAVASLNKALGFSADAFKFHIEDKRSDHACPGKLARNERPKLIAEIEAAMSGSAGVVAAVADHDDDESHIDTTAINLAEAEPKQSRFTFAKLNELADQGSRLAQHVRRAKNWFWGTGASAAGGTAALMTTENKTVGVFAEIVRDHPFVALAVFGAVLLAAAYIALKIVEKYLITAASDGRYTPRGG
jgi:hypothetical protein